ncbi:ribosome-binding factor A, partial [Mycoplasmopsis bovis]|uniref:ribosome-binding factor A n=1 Tax=Mycoplasmopsis bovis TaxID=28903 RepID=UPI003D2AF28E
AFLTASSPSFSFELKAKKILTWLRSAVRNASGYIRKVLSKTLNWRKIPELHFYIDKLKKKHLKLIRY